MCHLQPHLQSDEEVAQQLQQEWNDQEAAGRRLEEELGLQEARRLEDQLKSGGGEGREKRQAQESDDCEMARPLYDDPPQVLYPAITRQKAKRKRVEERSTCSVLQLKNRDADVKKRDADAKKQEEQLWLLRGCETDLARRLKERASSPDKRRRLEGGEQAHSTSTSSGGGGRTASTRDGGWSSSTNRSSDSGWGRCNGGWGGSNNSSNGGWGGSNNSRHGGWGGSNNSSNGGWSQGVTSPGIPGIQPSAIMASHGSSPSHSQPSSGVVLKKLKQF